jgi:methylglutamate dehydrogenase subunit A
MAFPKKAKYVVIGAGIHGLSTAWHLAEKIKNKNGNGSNNDIVVIDKSGIASGASGVACGVVRNNYFQPAMRELMMHSVKVWESDPKNFHYHPVGYMQISPESMHKDVGSIFEQQKAIGYESEFIEGKKDSMKYMKNMFHDWQAKGITSVLHEKRGGYANNTAAIYGLADKAESCGVRILTGTEVTGFKRGSNSKAVTGVVTSKGTIDCEQVIVGAGPWVKTFWDMLELPKKISIKDDKGKTHKDYPMWIYWMLTEGVLGVDPNMQKTDDGKMPPVIHVDSDAHLFSDVDGSLITDKMWGIYYKPDFNFKGIQGGAAPYKIMKPVDDVKVDPYGPDSPEFQTTAEFAHMWTSALAHCQKRFKGKSTVYHKGPSGGLGCFTPDSFPIFDKFCENVYMIADSNHGYKMIGVGDLVSDEILGKESSLLKPFRFNRYAKGELHPVSSSPFPWS